MRNFKQLFGTVLFLGALSGAASAQFEPFGWTMQCVDPDTLAGDDPLGYLSDDYSFQSVSTELMSVQMGTAGTVTYGEGPCSIEEDALDAEGRFTFRVGSVGSVQDVDLQGAPLDGFFVDDFMALSRGAGLPFSEACGDFAFANIIRGEEDVFWADGGIQTTFIGASQRYFVAIVNDGEVETNLQVRLVGDAARMQWRLTNLTDEALDLGLYWAVQPHSFLATSQGGTAPEDWLYSGAFEGTWSAFGGAPESPIPFTPGNPYEGPGAPIPYYGYVTTPTTRPIRTDRKFFATDTDFPSSVSFNFSQKNPYGLKLVNRRGDGEPEDLTEADQLTIKEEFFAFTDTEINPNVFGDNTGLQREADVAIDSYAAIQRFPAQNVPPGGTREIVHYMRGTWSVGSYLDPYTVVVDAPQLVNSDVDGVNGLANNPFRVRVWVDNQYALVDREIELQNVEVEIDLPDGLSLQGNALPRQSMGTVAPNQLEFVEFIVVADGVEFGDLPVTVTVSSVPGVTKEIDFQIPVAATPQVELLQGPNLISVPYDTPDRNLDAMFGQTTPSLENGVNYQAFKWDPVQSAYVPATDVQRGESVWVVPDVAPSPSLVPIENAVRPTDTPEGGLLVTMRNGWNLIANPYNYQIPVSQLIGVPESNPDSALSWNELISQGFINSTLATFVQDGLGSGQYQFIQDVDAQLLPKVGYWVFVNSQQPVRIQFPPVFKPGLAPSIRSSERELWNSSDRQWRLQLAARSATGMDSSNYVAVVDRPDEVDLRTMLEPPMAPGTTLQVSLEEIVNGTPTRLAQVVSNGVAERKFDVVVQSAVAGEVTLTWPNLPNVPRNVRFRLTDVATGETRNLRSVSGYTFNMAEPGTRQFELEMIPGGSVRPVIGNVLVSRGRDPKGPVTINYALSADALVTVRVMSGTGREVYTITRGRSDAEGENSVTWALRDNANRAVAPGVYQVEILAETPSGERVRKTVPVTVIR